MRGPADPGPEPDRAAQVHHRVTEALRPGVMRGRLLRALGGEPGEPCHVLDAKYEPGVRATVLYRLGGRLVRGDVTAADAGPAPAAGVLVPPGVRVWCYPDDPDLPSLPVATDPAVLGRVLGQALPRDGGRVVGTRIGLLRYRPGRRVTLRVTLRTAGAGEQPAASCVAKLYHDPRKAAAVAAEGYGLAASGRLSGGSLDLAPVLAHVPHLALVVQGLVEGRGMDAVLVAAARGRAGGGSDAVARAATALAALHALPVLSDRVRPVTAELDRFLVRARRVSAVDPEAGARLAGLAERLRDLEGRVPVGCTGLVHGDCKPSQFLLGRRDVTLLDLDHCGVADPASDVGTFVASLRQLAVRQALRAGGTSARQAWASALGETFVGAYAGARRTTGGPPPGPERDLRTRISWYEAVALERKALRSFARAPASPLPAALVAEGHRCLDSALGERR